MGYGKDYSDKKSGEARQEADRNTRAALRSNPARAAHGIRPPMTTHSKTQSGSAHPKGHKGK